MNLLNWWPWQIEEATREELKSLKIKLAKLELELELEQMRSERLAFLNEELRQWINSNLAVSSKISKMLGGMDEVVSSKPSMPKQDEYVPDEFLERYTKTQQLGQQKPPQNTYGPSDPTQMSIPSPLPGSQQSNPVLNGVGGRRIIDFPGT